MTLDYLAEIGPPKAVIYFGDTLRSNPGDHFLGLLNPRDGYDEQIWEPDERVVHGANSSGYERVINQAAIRGVRFYTVQAQGPGFRRFADGDPLERAVESVHESNGQQQTLR